MFGFESIAFLGQAALNSSPPSSGIAVTAETDGIIFDGNNIVAEPATDGIVVSEV